jgi:cytochrome P450
MPPLVLIVWLGRATFNERRAATCPGRAPTLMELRVITEELLRRTSWIEPARDRPAVRETPPAGGWARVPVVLR